MQIANQKNLYPTSSLNNTNNVHLYLEQAVAFPKKHVLQRYMRDRSLPRQVAQEHEAEFCRFIAIHAAFPMHRFGMRGPVDGYWHTFLLFTQSYQQFCQQVVQKFVHHTPAQGGSERTEEIQRYSLFLRMYKDAFGESAPAEVWPRLHSNTVHDGTEECGAEGCDAAGGCDPI